MMEIVELSVTVFYTYLSVGLLFGLWFIFKGIYKIDSGANGTSIGFRLLIFPGAIILWPVLLRKYLKA